MKEAYLWPLWPGFRAICDGLGVEYAVTFPFDSTIHRVLHGTMLPLLHGFFKNSHPSDSKSESTPYR